MPYAGYGMNAGIADAAAKDHAHEMTKARKSVSDQIEADGPEADAYRAAVGKTTYDLNVQQYGCAGLNFGYFYQGSPIIVYDGEAGPLIRWESSRHRGTRLPHIWLADRRSLYDAMGPYYTLLRLDPNLDVSSLTNAAAAACVPLTVLDVCSSEAPELFRTASYWSAQTNTCRLAGKWHPSRSRSLVEIVRGAGFT